MQILWNLPCYNNSTTWAFLEMFIDPTHVVQYLPNGSVAALRKLEFNHDRHTATVKGQQVNSTAINLELHSILIAIPIKPKTWFQHMKIRGKKIAKI